jgi:hypothetical protein
VGNVFRVSYRTRHFEFEAHDTDKDRAIGVLIAGLQRHAKQYSLEPDWWQEGFHGVPTDEIFEIQQFEIGAAYRDREIL